MSKETTEFPESELPESEDNTEREAAEKASKDTHKEAGPKRPHKEEEEKPSVKAEIFSWIRVIIGAIVIALFMDFFIIANAVIPTGSMENTIMPGSRIIGFRLSYVFTEPERGDIVIFKYPDNPSVNYIKRLIGLPGDTVEIRDGLVYINGSEEPLEEDYLSETPLGDFGPYVVPEDCYFMMGDNRNSSNDSRYWNNTFVTRDELVAKAIFMYYPSIQLFEDVDYGID